MRTNHLFFLIISISLLILFTSCFDDQEEEEYWRLVNPTPSNGAVGVDPGEPAAKSLGDFPDQLNDERYTPYLASSGDTLFWYDFNGNGEYDPPTFDWETESNVVYAATMYTSATLTLWADDFTESIYHSDEWLVPLLENTEHRWRIAVYLKDLNASEDDPGSWMSTSATWSFTTGPYDIPE